MRHYVKVYFDGTMVIEQNDKRGPEVRQIIGAFNSVEAAQEYYDLVYGGRFACI